jgi:hypothetical protein
VDFNKEMLKDIEDKIYEINNNWKTI